MRSLPVYKSDTIAIERVAEAECDSGCRSCAMGGKSKVTCMPPSSKGKAKVLVVGDSPSYKYAELGEPFSGGLEHKLKMWLLKLEESVAFDYAVKCPGKPDNFSAERCRPYSRKTMLSCDPERIILLGKQAQESYLGRSYNATQTRRGYATTLEGIPVFCLPSLQSVEDNTVLFTWLKEDLQWALTADPSPTPYGGQCRVIETVADARLASAALDMYTMVAVDLESFGQMYCADYKVVCLAVSAPGTDVAWVWNEDALDPQDPRRDALLSLLKSKKIAAHSADYEWQAISQHFGIEINIGADTKVSTKLLAPDDPADLDTVSVQVGMGGHKSEAQAALAVVEVALKGLRKARAKPVILEWGSEVRINKNNVKQTRKVVVASREPSPIEQIQAIRDAWVEERTVNKEKTSYAALVGGELNDDWITAALSDGELKSYAYGLMDRELCLRYCALDTIACARKVLRDGQEYRKHEPQTRTLHQIMLPVLPVASRMMRNGILIDQPRMLEFAGFLDQKMTECVVAIEQYKPGLNLNSPKQKADFLFGSPERGGLGLQVLKETESGAPSTSAGVLKKLKDKHPVIQHMLDYAEVDKLQSNYARGLIPFIRDDGRIHSYINVTGTGGSRWTSSRPNINVLPSKGQYAKKAKSVFHAPEGYSILALDFSTLEIRVMAYLSGDKRMIELLNSKDENGDYLDFHLESTKLVNKIIWGDDLDALLLTPMANLAADYTARLGKEAAKEALKQDPVYQALADELARRRRIVKTIVFSLAYGQSPEGMAERAGCTVDEAKAANDAILGGFSGLRSWMEQQIKLCGREGGVWSYWKGEKARFRPIPDIAYEDRQTRGHGERVSKNIPVQSTAADYNTVSLIQVDEMIRKEGIDAKILLAVYDSEIFEVRTDIVEDFAKRVAKIMTSHYCGGVPLVVEAEHGPSYGEMNKLKV